MMGRLLMLVRREFWEHRALVVAPVVVAVLMFLSVLISLVTAGVTQGLGADGVTAALNVTPRGGTAVGLALGLLGPVGFLFVVMFFTVFFYCLDALYAERKDRSVLFWRSLPVTDTETVASKFATAAVAAPIVTFAVAAFWQLATLVAATVFIWIGGGDAGKLIWAPLPLGQVLSVSLYALLAASLLNLPLIGWFLFCSAFVKKSPFLWAVLPFALIPMLELLVFRSRHFLDLLAGHFGRAYSSLFNFDDADVPENVASLREVDIMSVIDIVGLITAPSTWIGFLVAAAFGAGAVYMRRTRTEADA